MLHEIKRGCGFCPLFANDEVRGWCSHPEASLNVQQALKGYRDVASGPDLLPDECPLKTGPLTIKLKDD